METHLPYVDFSYPNDTHQQIIGELFQQITKLENFYPTNSLDEIQKEGLTFKHNSWHECIGYILNKVYPTNTFRTISVSDEENNHGAKVMVNSKYQGKIINNILLFSFVNLYPNIINKLYQKGDLVFNNNKLGNLFEELLKIQTNEIEYFVKNSKLMKEMEINNGWSKEYYSSTQLEPIRSRIAIELRAYKKILINYLYGILVSRNRGSFYCNDSSIIMKYYHNFINIILENFKDDIVYLDTDDIYFRYSEHLNLEKFEEILKIIDLPYGFENGKLCVMKKMMPTGHIPEIDNFYNGLFIEKKKYILYDNENKIIKIKGFAEYKDKHYNRALDIKINKLYKNLKIE